MGQVCWGLTLTLTIMLMLLGSGMLPKVVLAEELLADFLSGRTVTHPVVGVGLLERWEWGKLGGCRLGLAEATVVSHVEASASNH